MDHGLKEWTARITRRNSADGVERSHRVIDLKIVQAVEAVHGDVMHLRPVDRLGSAFEGAEQCQWKEEEKFHMTIIGNVGQRIQPRINFARITPFLLLPDVTLMFPGWSDVFFRYRCPIHFYRSENDFAVRAESCRRVRPLWGPAIEIRGLFRTPKAEFGIHTATTT